MFAYGKDDAKTGLSRSVSVSWFTKASRNGVGVAADRGKCRLWCGGGRLWILREKYSFATKTLYPLRHTDIVAD